MKKGFYWIVVIAVGLLLIVPDYVKKPLGDTLFHIFGISPYTAANNMGLHLPTAIGFLMLVVGITGAVRYYRVAYPRILSRILIACIALVIVFPYISMGAMHLAKYNANADFDIEAAK